MEPTLAAANEANAAPPATVLQCLVPAWLVDRFATFFTGHTHPTVVETGELMRAAAHEGEYVRLAVSLYDRAIENLRTHFTSTSAIETVELAEGERSTYVAEANPLKGESDPPQQPAPGAAVAGDLRQNLAGEAGSGGMVGGTDTSGA